MSEKTWCKVVILGTMVLLGTFAGIIIMIDPFFHFHKPLKDLQYPINNERYQNNGMMKHFEYDAIITGTSMSQNFKASELDYLFGVNSIKVPFAGSRYKEISENLEIAIQHNPNLKMILRGMDYSFLVLDKDAAAYESYPEYLYDQNPFNDVYYVLNKEILIYHAMSVINHTKSGGKTTNFDEYGNWNKDYVFGKDAILQNFVRSPLSETEINLSKEEQILVEENVDQNMIAIAKKHPEVTFYIYIPPYSILYWDNIKRQGKMQWHLEAEELAIQKILEQDNIKLYSYTNQFDTICNLDNYKDEIHYSEAISSQILKWMAKGEGLLTKENYKAYLSQIEEFFINYDYEILYME